MNVLKYAGAYIALEIGSGFATGQEIMQFFASYGPWGLGSMLISMGIFAWVGRTVMGAGYDHRRELDVRPYQLFCGKGLGRFFEVFVTIYLFAMLAIMLSGAGASLQEYLHVNYYVGGVLMAVMVFISFACGLRKLIDVVGMMGPFIIIVTLIVATGTIITAIDGGRIIEQIHHLPEEITSLQPTPHWWMSGILYGAYNLVSSLAFLMALGRDADSAKKAALGGILGGVLLMVTAMVMAVALMSRADLTAGNLVPALELAETISPLMGKLFLFAMAVGIFSTAAPMLWTIVDGLTSGKGQWTKLLALLICLDALLLGQIPFDRLVSVVYPYTGYFGILLLGCIVRWNWKRKKTR